MSVFALEGLKGAKDIVYRRRVGRDRDFLRLSGFGVARVSDRHSQNGRDWDLI
jgi:hypothetical protein